MHHNLYIIYGLFAIAFAGAISYWRKFEKVKEQRILAYEYQNKFIGLADHYDRTGCLNSEYTWLVQNAFIVQRRMGSLGKMSLRQPFENRYIPNYEIITNTLSKFRSGIVHHAEIGYADDALLRYLKHMDEVFEQAENNLKNPFLWLRQGFRYIIALPIYLLDWFGILSDNTSRRIINNGVFQFLSNLSSLVAFLSGVVTILVGYDQTIAFIKRFLTH